MRPVMYLLSNPSVPMSTGKRAAQVAHAAVEAALLSNGITKEKAALWDEWRCGGHYTKIVLQTDDLATADRYLSDRGFQTALIIDEGRTEFTVDLTPTAIGVAIVDKDDPHVEATFSAFKLYRDKPDPSRPRKYDGLRGHFSRKQRDRRARQRAVDGRPLSL